MKKVQVLGPGCPKCAELYRRCQAAIDDHGLPAELEKVEDINRIVELGAMLTPALVVDGELKFSGKLPPKEQLVEYIR